MVPIPLGHNTSLSFLSQYSVMFVRYYITASIPPYYRVQLNKCDRRTRMSTPKSEQRKSLPSQSNSNNVRFTKIDIDAVETDCLPPRRCSVE